MPRTARIAPGDMIFHCLNRGNDGRANFEDDGDFAAFEGMLESTLKAVPIRLLAYCLMHNHWHLVLWPRERWRTGEIHAPLNDHACPALRYHRHRQSDGRGHVYQGAFRSFPVQEDRHFLVVGRYVERNPLRAGLVKRAENWKWSSLWRRERGSPSERGLLSEWPVQAPAGLA